MACTGEAATGDAWPPNKQKGAASNKLCRPMPQRHRKMELRYFKTVPFSSSKCKVAPLAGDFLTVSWLALRDVAAWTTSCKTESLESCLAGTVSVAMALEATAAVARVS